MHQCGLIVQCNVDVHNKHVTRENCMDTLNVYRLNDIAVVIPSDLIIPYGGLQSTAESGTMKAAPSLLPAENVSALVSHSFVSLTYS